MKKFTALLLIFSLMAISCATMTTQRQKRFESSKERKRGAKLIITKTDGQQIEGELITVKPNSLLLLSLTGRDISVDIVDIKVIRIVKKSKGLQGIGLGLLIGAGTGAILGYSGGGNPDQLFGFTAAGAALMGGIFLGAIGLLVGGTLGFASGIDNTIQIEGMTDSELHAVMYKLRKKARIRDYK